MKNFLTTILLVLFGISLCTNGAFAQGQNLALTSQGCVCTHSGGGSGYPGYGPENYNDGLFTAWGWTSTGANPDPNSWVQFNWGSNAKSIGEVKLFMVDVSTRYHAGGRVQYWNGSAWINHYDYTVGTPGLIKTITFPAVTTTMLRLTNFTTTGSQNSNPNWYEIELRSTFSGMNNAGISAMTSPSNFCPGTFPVEVTLNNYGFNNITSATINWTVNSVAQSPVNWTGLIDTNTRSTTVQLTSGWTFAANTPYVFKVWSANPNGTPDTVRFNDTLNITKGAAISGTFTIGGSAPDFANFTAAVNSLITYGVCGPVVFNVRNGTYTEKVTIPDIQGASAVNTITFQSETGSPAGVNLTYAGQTLMYSGAKYITWQNMTITSTGTATPYNITLGANSMHNKFIGNIINNGNVNTTYGYCVYAYNVGNLDDTQFLNNTFLNGYIQMYLYGGSTTLLLTNWVISGNTFSNTYTYGIYCYYSDAIRIQNNTITTASTSTSYLLYLMYAQNQRIVTGNKLIATGAAGTKYLFYFYYNQALPGQEGITANNFIYGNGGSGTLYALYQYYSTNQKFFFNTIATNNTYASSRAVYSYYGSVDYIDNIFYNAGPGYAMYTQNTTPLTRWDYNLYYTGGTYLGYYNTANVTDINAWKVAAAPNDQNSISRPVTFTNLAAGDLHLAGSSQNDMLLTGVLKSEVTNDIDNDFRVIPYRGADEACYIMPGSVTYGFVDGSGNKLDWAQVPGTVNLSYSVAFPATGFPVTITVNFINPQTNQIAFVYTFSATKLAGQTLSGIENIPVPGTLPPGAYKIDAVFHTNNSCDFAIDWRPGFQSLLLVPQGQQPCVVWPGDVDNDGIVNYVDRAKLNKYIQTAALRQPWLNGPPRYRAEWEGQPIMYLTWEGQAGSPWTTSEGCYMDTDGSGQINNFDYLAIKINWMKKHGPSPSPKSGSSANPQIFDMNQNYPNPFNPSTTIQLSVPEASQVTLLVTDMLGREVATLVNGRLEAGMHPQVFDASKLASGLYIATVNMTGLESGMTFNKTLKMTLSK